MWHDIGAHRCKGHCILPVRHGSSIVKLDFGVAVITLSTAVCSLLPEHRGILLIRLSQFLIDPLEFNFRTLKLNLPRLACVSEN